MAEVPTKKSAVTKATTPAVAAPAKPVAAAPVIAKKVVAPVKPPFAEPQAEAPQPLAVPVAKPEWKVAAPVAAAVPVAPAVSAEKAQTAPEVTSVIEPAAPPVAVAAPVKGNTMNDTVNTATAEFQTRAKDAATKGTQAIQDLVEFSKGNVEAMMASGRIAAKGAEEIAKYSAEYGRATVERANATAKQFAAVKSPTEFFQLQGDVAKQTLDALVAEGSKFTESYLKLLGDIAQPISNRVSVAVDKVKTTVAA